MRVVNHAIEYERLGVNFWTGKTDLIYKGKVFRAVKGTFRITGVTVEQGLPRTRGRTEISLWTDQLYNQFKRVPDLSNERFTIRQLVLDVSRNKHTDLGVLFRARVSNPTLNPETKVLTHTNETLYGVLPKQGTRYFNDNDWKTRHPNDDIFEYQPIYDEGIKVKWPP